MRDLVSSSFRPYRVNMTSCPKSEGDVWRLKAVAQAEPDALARILLLLETQNIVPLRFTAQRAPVRGRTTLVLEIEIEFAANELAPDAFSHMVAIITQLPTVVTAVVPDPIAASAGVIPRPRTSAPS